MCHGYLQLLHRVSNRHVPSPFTLVRGVNRNWAQDRTTGNDVPSIRCMECGPLARGRANSTPTALWEHLDRAAELALFTAAGEPTRYVEMSRDLIKLGRPAVGQRTKSSRAMARADS
jgi:hypothetical protein